MHPISEDRLASTAEHEAAVRPRRRFDVLILGDLAAALLLVAATFLAAGSLLQDFNPDWPTSYALVPPLASLMFALGLLAMYLLRDRRGIVRVLSALGAGMLGVWAMALDGEVDARRLFAFYWVPALLAITGAIALVHSHRKAAALERRAHKR